MHMCWKYEIQLLDLPDNARLEVTCLKCSDFRYEPVNVLMTYKGFPQKYLDEIEAKFKCRLWGCGGKCRLSLPSDVETEGFQGGLT